MQYFTVYAHPSRQPQIQGKPSKKWDITVIEEASTREGITASLITMPLSLFRAVGSSPRPARVKMITRATFLYRNNDHIIFKQNEQSSANECSQNT
jgi:hypothetical protein